MTKDVYIGKGQASIVENRFCQLSNACVARCDPYDHVDLFGRMNFTQLPEKCWLFFQGTSRALLIKDVARQGSST